MWLGEVGDDDTRAPGDLLSSTLETTKELDRSGRHGLVGKREHGPLCHARPPPAPYLYRPGGAKTQTVTGTVQIHVTRK